MVCAHRGVVKHGEHFFDNFSQMVRHTNLRVVCAEACARGFTICRQWDTSTAFLYAPLEEGTEIYVHLAPGLGEFCGVSTNLVQLVKNTYGLPSAPAGFEKFRGEILTGNDCKMTKCLHDESVFIRTEGRHYVIICTHVDDYLVVSNSKALYDEVYKGYFSHVSGEDGELDFMLGINFDVSYEKQTIKIYAKKHISRLMQKYGRPTRSSKVPCLTEHANLSDEPLPQTH